MSDSKRSGYAIRADILGMAIGILESRNSRQFDNEMFKEEVDREPINPYATEDVLVVAEKLYAFVERGSNHGFDVGSAGSGEWGGVPPRK